MEFQITSVENGWLFAEIITAQERIPFANSRVEGGQMPGALLRSLTALLAGSSMAVYIGIAWAIGSRNVRNIKALVRR